MITFEDLKKTVKSYSIPGRLEFDVYRPDKEAGENIYGLTINGKDFKQYGTPGLISMCVKMLYMKAEEQPNASIKDNDKLFKTVKVNGRYIFHTDYSDYSAYNGSTVTVIRPLNGKETAIAETGLMYRVRASDGKEMDAFEDELTPTA